MTGYYKRCNALNFSKVFYQQRRKITVWPNEPKIFEDGLSGPKNGFGNQLYGVVQGAIISYILERQMILKWKFSEFFENTFDWVIEESVEKAIERGEVKGEGSFDSVFTL